MQMAAAHHPAWERLGRGARSLHARNCHQILGRDLDDPVSFVVCWTPDGATTHPGPSTGGTGQALRIAAAHDIPVFNLARADHLARVRAYIATHRLIRREEPRVNSMPNRQADRPSRDQSRVLPLRR